MLGNVVELATAAYEVVTVVTGVILNYEYIRRKWLEEYILSIVFLVTNGVVMGFVGLGIDKLHKDRYVGNAVANKVVGFCLGLLQLRVLVETVFASFGVMESKRATAEGERTRVVGGLTVTERWRREMQQRMNTLRQGLMYVTFIQVITRDIPLFVLQANATIHYRKWKFIDLFTVFSTFLMLTRGATMYVTKEDSGGIRTLAFLFMVGQFVFRLGAILLMAMTTGLAIVVYAVAIIVFAIIWTAELRLAHPSQRFFDQLPRAIVFFPFFTLFVVDGSLVTARYGSAVKALHSSKLLKLHIWRCVENIVGIALAVCLPRYTDFGTSSDTTVLIAGAICAAVYVVTLVLFYCGVHYHDKRHTHSSNSSAAIMETPVYNQLETPSYL